MIDEWGPVRTVPLVVADPEDAATMAPTDSSATPTSSDGTPDRPTRVSETVVIPGVAPHEVFAHLTDPANHVSGGGHPEVVGPIGPARLTGKGDRFGMRMRWKGLPYRTTNTVVEFAADERIAWRHFGGHRWRYELEPVDGGTRVTESFDLSPVPSSRRWLYHRFFGFPRGYRRNLRNSLDDLRDRLTAK